MDNKKKNHQKKNDHNSKKEKEKLDEELNQTFPASDPPTRTRPGHEKDSGKDE